MSCVLYFFFFFQAEDGIRDLTVTGVQTCALPISRVKRLDTPPKVDGSAEFGIDVKRPGLLVAVIARSPVFGGKVKSFDATKAKAVPGVRHVVEISSGVAVVADGYWPAKKGRDALEITWDEGPNAGDRKSTRLNSSHSQISYAVFCLKKKKNHDDRRCDIHSHTR